MKKSDTVSFSQASPKKRKRLPKYVIFIVLICFFVGLASFAVLFIHNDFDIEKTLGLRKNESSSAETEESGETTLPEQNFAGSINFLFVCEQDKQITFCNMVSVSPADGKIRVKPVEPGTMLDTDDGIKPLAELFETSGIDSVCDALSKKYTPITKYVCVTEKNFVKLLRYLGPVELITERDYEYNIDNIRYTYSAGAQKFTAEILLNIMKYAAEGEELLRLQATAAAAIIQTHFTPAKTEKGEDHFSAVINLVSSDITAFDYNLAEETIKNMAKTGVEVTVIS